MFFLPTLFFKACNRKHTKTVWPNNNNNNNNSVYHSESFRFKSLINPGTNMHIAVYSKQS